MSIEKDYDSEEFIIECDNEECSEIIYFPMEMKGENWQDMIDAVKEEDWQICKEDSEWKHYCPEHRK